MINLSNEAWPFRAYRIADNELAARASWDTDLLRDELLFSNLAASTLT